MSGEYRVKILADSISADGNRLTTMEVTIPRIVLAEFNTHRMFSRNSASSRAIPVSKQIERIEQSPFVPSYWGKNQPGMQAETELGDDDVTRAIEFWLKARDGAVDFATMLLGLKVHKQLANRLLEPFSWQTVIVTATEWDNFFALRANPMAQPEIRIPAEMMLDAYERSEPNDLTEGEWHLPLIQDDERDGTFENTDEARKISAARCARVSYLTHDGVRDTSADLELYESLVKNGHMSPLEHVATPFSEVEWALRDLLAKTAVLNGRANGLATLTIEQVDESLEFNGNFRGWTQLRKLVANEDIFGSKRTRG